MAPAPRGGSHLWERGAGRGAPRFRPRHTRGSPDTAEPDDAVWQIQLAALVDHVQRWSGRRASVIEMSRGEVNHGLTIREPFLVEAAREGWVVAGKPLPELAGSGT